MGAAALLAACLLGGTAHADTDAWDVFVDRCLTPMAEVEPPRLDGLAHGGAEMAREHFDAEKLALMQTYAAGPGIALMIQPEGAADHPGCLVLADDDPDGTIWDRSTAWLDAAQASGRWETRGGSILGPAYHSTDWREPKLRFVRIEDPNSARVIFAMSETDLEA